MTLREHLLRWNLCLHDPTAFKGFVRNLPKSGVIQTAKSDMVVKLAKDEIKFSELMRSLHVQEKKEKVNNYENSVG